MCSAGRPMATAMWRSMRVGGRRGTRSSLPKPSWFARCLTGGSCWIPGAWDLPMSYHPIVVTLSSLKPFFFNGLKKEVVFQKWRWSLSYCPSKSIAVDKQADDEVVHLYRFREADRLADQAFDP